MNQELSQSIVPVSEPPGGYIVSMVDAGAGKEEFEGED